MPRIYAHTPVEERFERYVVRPDDPGACWDWAASTFSSGYPAIAAEAPSRKMLTGHRLSYEMHVGPIPDAAFVLHRCDNPRCTNPRHLFLGTHLDNIQDKVSKGRQKRGDGHWRAKITQAIAEEIRTSRAAGATQKQIAEEFKVSRALVGLIVNNKSWIHS